MLDEIYYFGSENPTSQDEESTSIKSFNTNNKTVWIYVTATYLKPKICKDIQDILTWNMMDIGFIKNMQIDKLKKYKNDNLFNQILDKYNINNLKLEYEIVPKMNITALKIDESKINQIADTIDNYELDKGWCIDGLFDIYDKQFKNDTELFNVSVKIFKDTELQKSLISKCITHNDKIVIMVYLPLNSGIDTLQKFREQYEMLVDDILEEAQSYVKKATTNINGGTTGIINQVQNASTNFLYGSSSISVTNIQTNVIQALKDLQKQIDDYNKKLQ